MQWNNCCCSFARLTVLCATKLTERNQTKPDEGKRNTLSKIIMVINELKKSSFGWLITPELNACCFIFQSSAVSWSKEVVSIHIWKSNNLWLKHTPYEINLVMPHERTKALLHSYCRTVWELFASEVQRSKFWSGMFYAACRLEGVCKLVAWYAFNQYYPGSKHISIIVTNL